LKALPHPIQYIFFSASYDDFVLEKIAKIVSKANKITVPIESVKPDNIKQYYYKCNPKGKIDFIKSIYRGFTDNT
jgi:superfamily II DNA/RNA helicase